MKVEGGDVCFLPAAAFTASDRSPTLAEEDRAAGIPGAKAPAATQGDASGQKVAGVDPRCIGDTARPRSRPSAD